MLSCRKRRSEMNLHFTALATAIVATSLAGQTPSVTPKAAASKSYTPPKTPWGDPDIKGRGPAHFNTPRQRPANLKDKDVLWDDEFAQTQAQRSRQSAATRGQFADQVTINPPSYWSEGGTIAKQTSMIIDPPDGRMPPMTPEAQKIIRSERGGLRPGQNLPDRVDSWEDFDYYSRCISRGFPSTMLYTLYDYGNEIVQGPGYVAIRSEMVHETRVIPTDGWPHAGKGIKTYMGNSVGHWEGNTLV